MAKSCKGCRYYRPLAEYSRCAKWVCHYILDTGEPRGCSAENCTKKRPLTRNGQKNKENN